MSLTRYAVELAQRVAAGSRPTQVTDPPPRFWYEGPGEWQGGPWLLRSADEYGRRTLLLRLPGERAVCWAYRWCPGGECGCGDRCPGDGYPHHAWRGNQPICEYCVPGSTACRLCGTLNYTCGCFSGE